MMKSYRWHAAMIGVLFLMCGLLRIVLYSRDFFDIFAQLFTGVVVVSWQVTVKKRVTDRVLRTLLGMISLCFLLFLLSQTVNYRFAQDVEAIRRYAWYLYYVLMTVIAELFFYISVCCYRDPRKKRSRLFFLPLLPGIIVCAGFLTNDLHSLAFRFLGPERLPSSPKAYGPLFILFYIQLFSLLLSAFVIIIKKYRLIQTSPMDTLLQLLPVIVFVIISLLDGAGHPVKVNGIVLWQIGELFCYCLIAFLEMLIDYGLIPANTQYEKLFELTSLSAVILDGKKRPVYFSAGTEYPFHEDENSIVMQRPVSGGEICWLLDIGPLNRQNQKLQETLQQIEARNAYLSEEAATKKEKAEIETRNRIYDNISHIVKPQLDRIDRLTAHDSESLDEQLKTAAVLGAYIKRRSNMEFLSENGVLPFEELGLALMESLSYLQLTGIRAAVHSSGSGMYPDKMIVTAYERAETVIEDSLESLKALMISLRASDGEFTMRMMIEADSFRLTAGKELKEPEGFTVESSADKEGQDIILSFTYRKGGCRR